jgi:glutamate-1-semialdehyde-2,1-aminomutase
MARNQTVIAIIQARMDSTRLPGKVLADILGRPMLWHVVNRVRTAGCIDDVAVATSTESADDAISDFCAQNGIECFRGSETDVLDRFYRAAKRFRADVVVRITADCPLIDPQVVNRVVRMYLEGEYDYVANNLRYTYPDGLDTEIFSFGVLEATWREARLPAELEHVTPYIRASGRFQVHNVENEVDLSARKLRWTVDELRDLEFIRVIYRRLGRGSQSFGMSDVLRLLDEEPSLMAINEGIIRNEGYYKSLASEPPLPPQNRELKRSYEFKKKAEELIPSCSQTFSKGSTQFVQGVAPVFLARGNGSHVWDVDGNEYIDFIGALGPVILGYSYPMVNEAVRRQLEDGVAFSLPHPLEVELAALLCEIIPCAEMVRFGKNGSDATSGAVRVARAYTERDKIVCCGYHGWQDWYIGTTTRNKGVPKAVADLTFTFSYNNLESLEQILAKHREEIAAVIMEPVGVVEPQAGFLEGVAELAHAHGALLIFDEIITGFRMALGGAQEYYGVIPDLACFGKAMGNGFPTAAVVGRREVMELFDEVFFSFTFGGDALSLAATLATIQELREKKVIPWLWEQGEKLKDGYNVLAEELGVNSYTQCIGYPPRTVMTFKDKDGQESLMSKSIFQQEVLKRGILSAGYHNVSLSHTNADIEYTLRVYRDALRILAMAVESGDPSQFLEGEPVQPVFRRL